MFCSIRNPVLIQNIEPYPAQVSSVPIMTLQIVTYIVAAVSVLCVALILVKVSQISL